ncbi:hypothetical protein E4U21_006022 [Claviceps maximensis]|nr:hypothetical protein E4U21_006022 [Claviceps maximensis]
MDDMASQHSDATAAKTTAPKDKNCPFCGQAFTSSSLGRHLDLYIKEKNPKPSDGVHDVEAIKKLRGSITRRQTRGLTGPRKDSTSSRRARLSTKREASLQDDDANAAKSVSHSDNSAVESASIKYPVLPHWETPCGVIDDVYSARGPGMPQNASKQPMQKTQLELRQELADAMDTARAAELALRELLGSCGVAKQRTGNQSMPFDFDPLALDFPALILQCLQPPPTLFSSTQYPTSTSWSVQLPGEREFNALRAFFDEGFKAWRTSRASALTAATGEEHIIHTPSSNSQKAGRNTIKRAEKAARDLESSVEQHLQSAYTVWDSLPTQKRQEIWILELARGVGRKHTEIENMKEQQYRLKQENTHLKIQIDQLNRIQQPPEFQLLSPTAISTDRDVVSYAYEQGIKWGKCVGFDVTDRHVDISTLVTKSIERWKNVIMSTRAASDDVDAQSSFAQPIQTPTSHDSSSRPQSQSVSREFRQKQHQQQHQHQQQQHHHHHHHLQQHQRQRPSSQQSNLNGKRLSITRTTAHASEHSASSTNTTGPPSMEDEVSDQDADAEMEDDDNFAMMDASCAKNPHASLHLSTGVDVPRTQGLVQQQQGSTPDMRFMMQSGVGSPIVSRSTMGMSRSIPDMNMAMEGSHMQGGDMALMQQVRGDTLYMDNGM